jgi:hypothetical protein
MLALMLYQFGPTGGTGAVGGCLLRKSFGVWSREAILHDAAINVYRIIGDPDYASDDPIPPTSLPPPFFTVAGA